MKIIHLVIGKANPKKANGVNKSTHLLASNQKALGYHVEVWGITPTPDSDTPERPYQLRLFQYHPYKPIINKKLREAIDECSTEHIFHFQGSLIWPYIVIANYLKAKSFKWIISPRSTHNPFALKRNVLFKKVFISLFEKYFIENAFCVHTLHQTEASWIQKAVTRNFKYQIIRNGEDFNSIPKSTKNFNETKKGDFIIGYIGRLDIYQKGLDLLLEGFELYLKNQNAKLWIIGEGPDQELLNKKVKNSSLLSTHTTLFGGQYGDEKNKLILKMDYFIHPSRWEGIPNSVIETSILGIPQLISKETNMAEDILSYDAGFVFEENTAQCIAQTIIKANQLYQKGELQKQSSNAIKLIKDKYDYRSIAKEFIEKAYS